MLGSRTLLMSSFTRERFALFQGDMNVQRMEPFQVVKYVDNQQVYSSSSKLSMISLLFLEWSSL